MLNCKVWNYLKSYWFFCDSWKWNASKRAPITQIDNNGYATFTPASIGLTTKGYNLVAARVSDGSVGLKISLYKYNGPITEAAQMKGVKDMPENSDNQKFSTTKTALEMTSKLIKNYNKLNNVDGVQ